MRVYDIIQKKRDGLVLSEEEIRYIIDGFTKDEIPDYQMSALLMAIYFNGMSDSNLSLMTDCMMRSGDTVDLSQFGDMSVDKHSTGGVGDKTTLIIAPIVAALGGKMAKMSGRGLGHTGGTVDKLEAIPGYKTTLSPEAFMEQVEKIGVAVIGQSGNLAPADKKIYALRDVTATVESIPLIAASIMSKKLAAGAKNIVLDVKVGAGAFMKTYEQARELAAKMVDIGKSAGRRVCAVITNMDTPLGCAVGNSLEVLEAAEILSGHGDAQLREICIVLSAKLVALCHNWDEVKARTEVENVLQEGRALAKFRQWIKAQGGNDSFIDQPQLLKPAPIKAEFTSAANGFLGKMDAEKIGKAACVLGAGREKTGDVIDFGAGIILKRKTGDKCSAGDPLAVLYTSDASKIDEALSYLENGGITVTPKKPETEPLIRGHVN